LVAKARIQMAIFPLVSLVVKGPSAKSLAVIEGLILVPLIGVLVALVLARTGLPFEIRMAINSVIGIPLVGIYARFASS